MPHVRYNYLVDCLPGLRTLDYARIKPNCVLQGHQMAYDGLMVSVSGVSGRVGAGLTPEIVAKFAAGFGAWASKGTNGASIVVGRDSRVSGPMFHRVVLSALQSVGCTIIDVGMAPTPTIQLAVEHHH